MTILNVVTEPADVLLAKAKPVKKFDKKLHTLLDNMYETMVESEGVGIAAPQVNESIQAVIVLLNVDSEDEEDERLELINPEIVEFSVDTNIDLEGCLSIPEKFGDVERSNGVRVEFQDRFGDTYKLEAYNYDARIIQHEIDHLNGVLFTTKAVKMYTDEEMAEMYGEEE